KRPYPRLQQSPPGKHHQRASRHHRRRGGAPEGMKSKKVGAAGQGHKGAPNLPALGVGWSASRSARYAEREARITTVRARRIAPQAGGVGVSPTYPPSGRIYPPTSTQRPRRQTAQRNFARVKRASQRNQEVTHAYRHQRQR